MQLDDLGIILSPGFRSRAYIQSLVDAELSPSVVVLLQGEEPSWDGGEKISVDLYSDGGLIEFKPGICPRETLQDQSAKIIPTTIQDVNSTKFLEILKGLPQKTFIYSGPGGCILKSPAFKIGKRYLHAHGGITPEYCGSTAFYYSILKEGTMGATVFWMNEGLDTGDVLLQVNCHPPVGVDIDRILDPILRADVLTKTISKLISDDIKAEAQDLVSRRVYYVIHPVLKHLALRKCGIIN